MDLPSNRKDVNESIDFSHGWNGDTSEQASQSTGIVFLKALIVCLIILCAVVGNVLVIFSVYRHHKLRRMTNYFIVSLAFADALVALMGMTFYTSFMIAEKWLFNQTLCSFWNSSDVFFSTASILNLCCISVDRYFSVFKPLEYPMKITGKVVAIMITCVWVLSGCISFLPIFLDWHTDPRFQNKDPEACTFNVSKLYAILSSSVSFWIPGIIIVVSYFLIYLKVYEQERLLRKHKVVPSLMRGNIDENGESEIPYVQIPTFNTVHLDGETADGADAKRPTMTTKKVRKMKQEFRVAKTLAIVVGAFILCWLPFSLLYISMTLCETCYCPPIVFEITVWVAYFNSVLNPIIYGYCNRDFREAFKEIVQTFVCCCTKISCLAKESDNSMDINCSNRSTENINLEEAKNAAE